MTIRSVALCAFRSVALCALLSSALATAQPPTIHYKTIHESYDAPTAQAGLALFLGSWLGSVGVAAIASDENRALGTDALYIPFVGPWNALEARADCSDTNSACRYETAQKVMLVADGIIQVGGAVTLVIGLLQPTQRMVAMRSPRGHRIDVSPTTMGGTGGGVAVSGHF